MQKQCKIILTKKVYKFTFVRIISNLNRKIILTKVFKAIKIFIKHLNDKETSAKTFHEDGDEIRLEKIELSSAHKTVGTFNSFIINQSLLKPGFTKF